MQFPYTFESAFIRFTAFCLGLLFIILISSPSTENQFECTVLLSDSVK